MTHYPVGRVKRIEADNKAKAQLIRHREEAAVKREAEVKVRELEVIRLQEHLQCRLDELENRNQNRLKLQDGDEEGAAPAEEEDETLDKLIKRRRLTDIQVSLK